MAHGVAPASPKRAARGGDLGDRFPTRLEEIVLPEARWHGDVTTFMGSTALRLSSVPTSVSEVPRDCCYL